jgi:dCMP deaminase
MTLAEQISTWSKDPSKKVGCVIVKDKRIIGTGYNGLPELLKDSSRILADKPSKRFRTVHAEMNAQHFCTKSSKNSHIFVTHHPCATCMANLLVKKPLSITIWIEPTSKLSKDWARSLLEAKEMAIEANVPVFRLAKLV